MTTIGMSCPGLVSASPASATAGSGKFTLTITGAGFVPGAVLDWNGAERTTTYVDSSHLTAAIPAADVSQAGPATLVVNNPGPSDSSSIWFTINSAVGDGHNVTATTSVEP